MAHGIQAQVGIVPAPGIEGDFASLNPRFSVLAGPGALVCGPQGVLIGRFSWLSSQVQDPDNAPAILNNFGVGPVAGFVGRHQQGLITAYLAPSGLLIPQGFGVTAYNGGPFWARNNGTTPAFPGNKAYANMANGAVSFAATGAPGSVALTTSAIAPGTAVAGTASISGNILTVTAWSGGLLYPGTILTGPTGVAAGTQVVYQLSSAEVDGAFGKTGVYSLNIGEQTVASSATLAGTYGVLTVGGGGPPVQGGILSGTGVTAGTVLWQQITATTWVVSPSQTAASTTITNTNNVETKWVAMSQGAVGELVKMDSQPLG
jgi:hypothetical protein